MKHSFFAISGPTASGKSALALALAKATGGEIVNADALQIYDCFSVLSARPSDEDLTQAPHHLYGYVSATEDYSVGKWLKDVEKLIDRTKVPLIFVGGTGLYFKALMHGFVDIPQISAPTKTRVEEMFLADGFEGVQNFLRQNDPKATDRIDMQNPRRVERALHVLLDTKKSIAQWQDETPPPILPLSNVTTIRVTPPRDWLYARIDYRTVQMCDEGAIDEVRAIESVFNPGLPAFRAIGVAEIIDYLQGRCEKADMLKKMQQETRNYAKRQYTWMRQNMRDWQFEFDPEKQDIAEFVDDLLHVS